MRTTANKLAVVFAFCLIALAQIDTARAASFDCAKASAKVEQLICDNPEISKLDEILGKDYQDVLGKANDEQKQRVVAEQKHRLKFTRNVCDKVTCLKHAYWSKQTELETFFEPKSPLYQHESDKAETIKQVLATAPLYLLGGASGVTSIVPNFCTRILDDLKQMNGVRLVDPVVQTMSYEDPALDPWKKQCRTMPQFNFSYYCLAPEFQSSASDVMEYCYVGYGLPPFKIYELPPTNGTGERRYFFYADDAYGPMNRKERGEKPSLGGGFAGFWQIQTTKCLSTVGNHWNQAGRLSRWQGIFADVGQGGRNGMNYNSIIEYKGQYYFMVLHEQHGSYRLDIEPTEPSKVVCHWSPIKQ